MNLLFDLKATQPNISGKRHGGGKYAEVTYSRNPINRTPLNEKNMCIVHITYAFRLGGIETMLRNIVNEQIKLVHEIHVIVINDFINKELYESLDKRIVFHNIGRHVNSKNPVPYIRLNLILKKINADVIHLHYSSIARFIWLPSLKNKLCVTQHDVCNRQNSKYLYKSKRIYAISNIVKQDVWNWVHLQSEAVLNGIRPELIDHATHERNGRFRIVQVSRLMHQKKGQHILIQAVHRLVTNGYIALQVDFIGDGESKDYLQTMVRKLDLGDYINFLGAKDQSFIFAHLHEYDLYVQPSIYEGFGLTVTEAMAAKVPVLVSENQGPLEIIDNGRFGYSFRNKDADDCAAKIELFLKGGNDKAMVDKAYARVQAMYNVKVTATTYLKKYKDFIDSDYAQIH